MVKILKYIVNNQNVPILFNTDTLHSEVSNLVSSAGFVIVNYDSNSDYFFAKCYGKSSSLNVNSNENDNILIEKMLNNMSTIDFD